MASVCVCVCVLCRLHICTCVFQCVVCAIKNLTKVLIMCEGVCVWGLCVCVCLCGVCACVCVCVCVCPASPPYMHVCVPVCRVCQKKPDKGLNYNYNNNY